ncbi:MAG TPA: serine hydrolase [Polyangiaceae bacterium]|nr:serine hydrolase [Polyangiaceae bacterium]
MKIKAVRRWGRQGVSSALGLALAGAWAAAGLGAIGGCSGSSASPPAASPSVPPAGEASTSGARDEASTSGAPLFLKPVNRAPQRWMVLGPFVQVPGGSDSREAALDHDYLEAIGGEAGARFEATTHVDVDGKTSSVAELGTDENSGVDLQAFYKDDTDRKVAYAYGELEWPRTEVVPASFGSDDGAAIWINGQRVHRVVTNARGVDPDGDHFSAPLRAGKNSVLVKVENGTGGWGFALTLLDAEGRERKRALAVRRHLEALELGPESDLFLLDAEFPRLVYRQAEDARSVFGDAEPHVRWFDPDRAEVQRPEKAGRYIAVVEQATRDGYTLRRMLTFAKLPRSAQVPPPDAPSPPFAEPLPLRGELLPGLSDAQRAELSRHVWRALADYLEHGQNAAIARLGIVELGTHPPAANEPAWLSSGFIRDAEQQLALRMQLEGRTPRGIAPPLSLSPPAPVLRVGSEREAGIAPGTVQRLRGVAKDWLKEDPNGFVVMLARRGVVFMHEGFGGFEKEQGFRPASIGKLIAGLTFARAVDQGLVGFDDPVSRVFPEWKHERTANITFRHCFNHIAGLPDHASHGGLYNAYLDNAFLVEDSAFVEPLQRHHYNGDSYNLTGKALELITGKTMWRLLYENVQKPFGENVTQFDLGFGDKFTARYVAEVGQMLLQDGAYGSQRLYSKGFLAQLLPQRVAAHAAGFPDEKLEWGIGQQWLPDAPEGDRSKAPLSPNTFGHGAASGSIFRVDPDHQLVVVIGRNAHSGRATNLRLAAKFVEALAQGLVEAKPAEVRAPQPVASAPNR